MKQRTISILGSTGSIGAQTLQTIDRLPGMFSLAYLTANRNIEMLEAQALKYNPRGVVIAEKELYKQFCSATQFSGEILCGVEGVVQAASADNDLIMSALVGFSGVEPTLAAIEAGADIALANKETLVSAGEIIMSAAKKKGSDVVAVDSEHSAILQCIVGEHASDVEKIVLTASGGPFRTVPKENFGRLTPEDALQHPNWTMGKKITIDSATLMNKGFEVIEAHWLFDVQPENIEVVVHPQSIVHSMVQFRDGSIKAQLGTPDMRIPIGYALTYPRRANLDFPRLNLLELKDLTFEAPNLEKFPCLQYAFDAMKFGGTAPAVLNAANEIAVYAFLEKKLRFSDIPAIALKSVETLAVQGKASLEDIVSADKRAREFAMANIGM